MSGLNSLQVWNADDNCFNPHLIYIEYFGLVPNTKIIYGVNTGALETQVLMQSENIIRSYSKQKLRAGRKKRYHSNTLYHYENQIMIHLHDDMVEILFSPSQLTKTEEWIEIIHRYKKNRTKTNHINLITTGFGGLQTMEIRLKKPKLDLASHYGPNFTAIHNRFLATLRKSATSGIYLFHGPPGTGKSTYIRYLIHQTRKKVIFIPPNLAAGLDGPGFTELLVDNAGSVFIIEDAEELIASRRNGERTGLSFLLNMTDGIIGESLGIQCIATFNTSVHSIDQALLRKGRLLGMHRFEPLPPEKAHALLTKLNGTGIHASKPMTLAEIYHYGEVESQGEPEERKIGFSIR